MKWTNQERVGLVIVIVVLVFLSSFSFVLLPVTQPSSQSQNMKQLYNQEAVVCIMIIVVLVFQSSFSLHVAQRTYISDGRRTSWNSVSYNHKRSKSERGKGGEHSIIGCRINIASNPFTAPPLENTTSWLSFTWSNFKNLPSRL